MGFVKEALLRAPKLIDQKKIKGKVQIKNLTVVKTEKSFCIS